MFKSAAAKIAHNSTIPALAGNRDIRPLQDLITSEKAVLQSFQRLSSDLTKSNECLRHWGSGEGDDLQDVLSASSTLLGYFSSALTQMVSHEASIREHMKSVRSMEENLDELRRRRKAVATKADTAEKKLAKMGGEHKNRFQQTELLNNLHEQIQNLDWDILSMEARLGDFKRSSAKNWMTLKFGGLLECAERATIVAEMGKMVIEEIPLDLTQPGQARKFYTGYDKTEKYIAEAQRCLSEVVFDPKLVAPTEIAKPVTFEENRSNSIDGLPDPGSLTYAQASFMQSGTKFGVTPTTDEFGNVQNRRGSLSVGSPSMTMPSPAARLGDDGSRIGSSVGEGTGSTFGGSSLGTPISPSASRFGTGSGQFSTFPTRKASLPGSGFGSPPMPTNQSLSLQPLDEGQGSSFASEVANALAYADRDPAPGKMSLDGPAPSYDAHDWTPSLSSNGLPRGAAPPAVEPNPLDNTPHAPQPTVQQSVTVPPSNSPTSSRHARESATTEDDKETQLPYASPPPIEHQLPPAGGGESQQARLSPTQERVPSPQPIEDEGTHQAAAREVAREMDTSTFSPPPGPPPGHANDRAHSPLQPPAPPFAQMRRISPPPVPANLEQPSPQVPPANGNQSKPPMTINVHSPSPSRHSFNSANASTYGTPPEMPAIQPLRTGSPASPSVMAPGARTISAGAFKRPGIRTPSGGASPSLPDVTPLALRKKKSSGGASLPSSPYPQDASPNPSQGQLSDPHSAPPPDYESSYEVTSSYSDQPGRTAQHSQPTITGGYEAGRFATNLDEGLR